MLIPKNIFPLAQVASRDEMRQNLCGVYLERGEKPKATATDGHCLISATWPETDNAEFPVPNGQALATVKDGFHAIIPSADWQELGKSVPRKTNIPVLGNAAVNEVSANGRIDAATYDLASVKSLNIRPVEGGSPDTAAVMPKGQPKATVGLNAHLAARVFKTLADMGEAKTMVACKVEVFSAEAPVRITATGQNGEEFTALIMPVRL